MHQLPEVGNTIATTAYPCVQIGVDIVLSIIVIGRIGIHRRTVHRQCEVRIHSDVRRAVKAVGGKLFGCAPTVIETVVGNQGCIRSNRQRSVRADLCGSPGRIPDPHFVHRADEGRRGSGTTHAEGAGKTGKSALQIGLIGLLQTRRTVECSQQDDAIRPVREVKNGTHMDPGVTIGNIRI